MIAGLTLSGADIAAGRLAFQPTAGTRGVDYAHFTFSVQDSAGLYDSTPDTLTFNVTRLNHVPTLVQAIAGQTSIEDAALSFALPVGQFNDTDADDSLSYSATLVDGSALPSWLIFSGATRTFSGTPGDAAVGSLSIKVTATDNWQASESGVFLLTVTNVNDAPTGTVAFSGTMSLGATLTASNTLADADGLGQIGYQWKADGAAINGATASTFVVAQTEVGKAITVTASYTDGHGTLESVNGGFGKTADIMAYSWKAHTQLAGVSISGAGHSGTSDATGVAHFAAVVEPNLALIATRPIPATESPATSSAVNLQDAIAILKMIVGLDVNGSGRPLSPYQALAADFDGNGTVGLTDAIGVLKHVVGLTSPEPTWHFVNESDLSIPGKAKLTPGAPAATVTADLSGNSPVHVGLVGYLAGDVNGSYSGPVSAQHVDPSYFTALVASHPGLTEAQFGVYP